MKTEKPNGHCQECGDEISPNLKHLLRICVDCSKLNVKQKLSLHMSGNKKSTWG